MTESDRLPNLIKSVETYWASQYTFTPTEYTGMTLDKTSLAAWVRLDITPLTVRQSGRNENSEWAYKTVLFTLDCFSRPSSVKDKLWQMAGKVHQALQRKDVPLKDYTNAQALVGYLRCAEAQSTNFGEDATLGFVVEHLQVTIEATFLEAIS